MSSRRLPCSPPAQWIWVSLELALLELSALAETFRRKSAGIYDLRHHRPRPCHRRRWLRDQLCSRLELIGDAQVLAKTIVYSAAVAARRALAEQHVEQGRRIVERQRHIVANKKAANVDATFAEQLLTQFESSLKMFEDDLAGLIKIGRL